MLLETLELLLNMVSVCLIYLPSLDQRYTKQISLKVDKLLKTISKILENSKYNKTSYQKINYLKTMLIYKQREIKYFLNKQWKYRILVNIHYKQFLIMVLNFNNYPKKKDKHSNKKWEKRKFRSMTYKIYLIE